MTATAVCDLDTFLLIQGKGMDIQRDFVKYPDIGRISHTQTLPHEYLGARRAITTYYGQKTYKYWEERGGSFERWLAPTVKALNGAPDHHPLSALQLQAGVWQIFGLTPALHEFQRLYYARDAFSTQEFQPREWHTDQLHTQLHKWGTHTEVCQRICTGYKDVLVGKTLEALSRGCAYESTPMLAAYGDYNLYVTQAILYLALLKEHTTHTVFRSWFCSAVLTPMIFQRLAFPWDRHLPPGLPPKEREPGRQVSPAAVRDTYLSLACESSFDHRYSPSGWREYLTEAHQRAREKVSPQNYGWLAHTRERLTQASRLDETYQRLRSRGQIADTPIYE